MRAALQNPNIRRVESAWSLAWIAVWGMLTTLGVYVFEESGTAAVAIVFLVRMLAGATSAPLLGVLADRTWRATVLQMAAIVEVAVLVTAAVVTGIGAPIWALLPIAVVEGVSGAALAPAHRGLVPLLAKTPAELAGANALTETVIVVSLALGPVVAGVSLALRGPALAFGILAVFQAVAAFQLSRVDRSTVPASEADHRRLLRQLRLGVDVILADRGLLFGMALVLTIAGFTGAMNVYVNPVAIDLLGLGSAGPAVLLAAVGVGALLGGLLVADAIRRYTVASLVVGGLLLLSTPVALVGIWPSVAVACIALLGSGAGLVFANVATTLIGQRLAPAERLSAVLGIAAVLGLAGMGIGGVAASGIAAALGIRGALVLLAGFLVLAAIVAAPLGQRLSRRFPDVGEQVALLRALPAFAALPVTTTESLARRMQPSDPPAGTTVIEVGDVGEHFYVLEAGSVTVTEPGHAPSVMEAPESFGEIALVQARPRTATVVANEGARLWSIDRESFLGALTTSTIAATEIRHTADVRLGSQPRRDNG